MTFLPALGQSDFRKLRESGGGYVDKTAAIGALLADPAEVLLFPRPRRFGKTLFMSALTYFLERRDEDLSHLFLDLDVWKAPAARAHFQKHPVLSLTFKDVKARSYEGAIQSVALDVQELYGRHRALLDGGALRPDEARQFERILHAEATVAELQRSLKTLGDHLARHHGQQVVILVDEYDTPIQSGYLNGFFDEVTLFFRNFFSAALKDNPSLFKGVLTGVLRIARENLFSGLNNVIVHSLLHDGYRATFGFTEPEVAALVTPGHMEEVGAWYNGYLFGGQLIYNPWSILNFIATGELRPYWVNTASTEVLEALLARRGTGLSMESEALLRGESIEARLDENIVLRDIDRQPEALWSFLLFSGYLKPVGMREHLGEVTASLAIPNREVRIAWRELFQSWLRRGLPERRHVEALLEALLAGDAATVEALLERLLLTVMSYQDPAGREPEKLYHGFILGLLVQLEAEYEVRSNRESGYGRADVVVCPRAPARPGVVMELKVQRRGETPEQALAAAARQVRERRYAEELLAAGASPVHELVAVFDGKRAWVQRAGDALLAALPAGE